MEQIKYKRTLYRNKTTYVNVSPAGEDPADVDDERAGQEHHHHQPRQEQEGDRGPQNQDH